eukprot:TRINITY_DN1991_c0_g1_i5.p5 TRINITY_DN1991_c0_g1~~TRINITY_DN1991_c0_g1_i5.p5  ORF type:complete len:172 (+),score=22.37 TRINITY_DN1991_c0_g1_i5:115-630(+)
MGSVSDFANFGSVGHMDNNQLLTFLALLVLVLFFICIVMVCTQLCKSAYRIDPSHLLSEDAQRQVARGKEVVHQRTPSRIKIVVAPRGQLYYAAASNSYNYDRGEQISISSNVGYVPLYEESISFGSWSQLSASQTTQATLTQCAAQGVGGAGQSLQDQQSILLQGQEEGD